MTPSAPTKVVASESYGSVLKAFYRIILTAGSFLHRYSVVPPDLQDSANSQPARTFVSWISKTWETRRPADRRRTMESQGSLGSWAGTSPSRLP